MSAETRKKLLVSGRTESLYSYRLGLFFSPRYTYNLHAENAPAQNMSLHTATANNILLNHVALSMNDMTAKNRQLGQLIGRAHDEYNLTIE